MINIGITDSELNFNFRLFCKTVSKSASWGFDRFRLFNSKWHTKVQVRRPDGSVVATQSFAPDTAFEHTFSFDLSENINNDEYSVYIAGVAVGQNFNQAYAYPTGYGATYGKNAEITYWDFREVNIVFSGTTGRIRFENNPITAMDGLSLLEAAEVNFTNCQLDAETLADAIIGLDNSEISNGTFSYSGNLAAPAERSLAAYNNLKDAKAWVMNGGVPVDAAPLYDIDYQEVMDFAVANEIPLPSQSQIDIDNQKIIDDKASGAYASRDYLFSFKGTATPAYKLICWKRKISAITYGSLTWSNNGVLGNGNNGYIDPLVDLYASGNYTTNDANVSFVSFENPTKGSIQSTTLGSTSTYSSNLILPTLGFYSINSDSPPVRADRSYLGLTSFNRISSATIRLISAISEDYADGSQILDPNTKPYILARNRQDSSGVDQYCDAGISMISAGSRLDSIHATLKSIWE